MGLPSPPVEKPPAAPPDPADEAVRNARMMERRQQLGLQGRMSTFLSTALEQSTPGTNTVLGG